MYFQKVIEDLRQQVAALQSKVQAEKASNKRKIDDLQAKFTTLESG